MKALYISYDGLLDQIGSSQILPYIKDISRYTEQIYVVSFEKKEKYESHGNNMRKSLSEYSLEWVPLIFTSKFGIVGKIFDLIKIHYITLKICFKQKIKIAHARGHIAAESAVLLKHLFGVSIIFDCRGLWVDERVNKGSWNLEKYFDRFQYKIFKKIERKIFIYADHIVVLTNRVVQKIIDDFKILPQKITVIPCCADFNHFKILHSKQIASFKIKLGIQDNTPVLGYLGSIGSMYKFESFIDLVLLSSYKYPHVCGLIVTKDREKAEELLKKIKDINLRKKFYIYSADRDEVPILINLFDVMINFLSSSDARIGTSPTRNAECYASGVPVVCSAGIGDVDRDIKIINGGITINNFDEESLLEVVDNFDNIFQKGGMELRQASEPVFSLSVAEKRYKNVYSAILKSI